MNKYELQLLDGEKTLIFGTYEDYDKMIEEMLNFIKLTEIKEDTRKWVMVFNNERTAINPLKVADSYCIYTQKYEE